MMFNLYITILNFVIYFLSKITSLKYTIIKSLFPLKFLSFLDIYNRTNYRSDRKMKTSLESYEHKIRPNIP